MSLIKNLTQEERERLQAMIDEQDQRRERKRDSLLERKAARRTASRGGRARGAGLTRPALPSLESSQVSTELERLAEKPKRSKLRQVKLTKADKEKVKDKVWEMIRDRHKT